MGSTKNQITIPQEKFVQELIKGKTQRQAYMVAYPKAKKWKDNSIDCSASKLLSNPKVKQRYEELNKKHQDKAIFTKDDMLKELKKAFYMAMGVEYQKQLVKNIIEAEDGELKEVIIDNKLIQVVDLKSVATISQQIAKLEGWHIDKIEHSGKIENEVTHKGLSKEELEKYKEELLNKLNK